LHTMNVKTTMLSGDKHTVVQYVAKALNIDNAFGDLLPEDKVEKVKQIKNSYKSVAFVGDGVNDAPALKLADIGLVVNEASDISKDVADIVLLDSNFKTIVNAIKEGRIIFKNIQKVVYYLLMDSFSAVLFDCIFNFSRSAIGTICYSDSMDKLNRRYSPSTFSSI